MTHDEKREAAYNTDDRKITAEVNETAKFREKSTECTEIFTLHLHILNHQSLYDSHGKIDFCVSHRYK
jgi:hypothetical protein